MIPGTKIYLNFIYQNKENEYLDTSKVKMVVFDGKEITEEQYLEMKRNKTVKSARK